MTETSPKPVRDPTTPAQALEVYLSLTGRRTFKAVARAITDRGLAGVPESTLARWGTEHEWGTKAKLADAQILERVVAGHIDAAVAGAASVRSSIELVAKQIAGRAAVLASTAIDLPQTVVCLLDLAKHLEVAAGGVSERTEHVGAGVPLTMAEKLRERYAPTRTTSPAEPGPGVAEPQAAEPASQSGGREATPADTSIREKLH